MLYEIDKASLFVTLALLRRVSFGYFKGIYVNQRTRAIMSGRVCVRVRWVLQTFLIINMLMPVKQNSFTHLNVLLVLTYPDFGTGFPLNFLKVRMPTDA